MDSYSVAVDVGGTFTDIVLCNLDTNGQAVLKVPSTPEDPSAGFLSGMRQILETNGVAPSQVKHIFHGTTIATNAILENKGAPVGLVVSNGFKFVLEIGRHGTPRMANPNSWVKPRRPVLPRDIVEVTERAGSTGEILTPWTKRPSGPRRASSGTGVYPPSPYRSCIPIPTRAMRPGRGN